MPRAAGLPSAAAVIVLCCLVGPAAGRRAEVDLSRKVLHETPVASALLETSAGERRTGHSQCVLKKTATLGLWEGRRLTVAGGQMRWSHDTACDLWSGPRNWVGQQFKASFFSERAVDLASLTAPEYAAPDADIPGGAGDAHRCLKLADEDAVYLWCAPEGQTMEAAMAALEAEKAAAALLETGAGERRTGHSQCVLKKTATLGLWEGRRLTVAGGQMRWSHDTACDLWSGPRNWVGQQFKASFFSERAVDLASLTAPEFAAPDADIPGGAGDAHRCLKLADVASVANWGPDEDKVYLWCAPEGQTMDAAMAALEAEKAR